MSYQALSNPKMTPDNYLLCSSCACGVSNDDWSHLDFAESEEEANKTMASIEGTLEQLGHLSHLGEYDYSAYWHCDLCNELDIGIGQVFVTAEYFRS